MVNDVVNEVGRTAMTVVIVLLVLVALTATGLRIYGTRSERRRRIRVNDYIASLPRGPVRELAQLQVRLDDAKDAARRAIAVADRADNAMTGDVRLVCARFNALVDRSAAEIATLVTTSTTPVVRTALLPPLRAYVEDVERVVGDIVSIAAASVVRSNTVELESIESALADAGDVVEYRAAELRALTR